MGGGGVVLAEGGGELEAAGITVMVFPPKLLKSLETTSALGGTMKDAGTSGVVEVIGDGVTTVDFPPNRLKSVWISALSVGLGEEDDEDEDEDEVLVVPIGVGVGDLGFAKGRSGSLLASTVGVMDLALVLTRPSLDNASMWDFSGAESRKETLLVGRFLRQGGSPPSMGCGAPAPRFASTCARRSCAAFTAATATM